jgi:Txe/YoeB family toxin of Txe-Axe toxin-antitoxin module
MEIEYTLQAKEDLDFWKKSNNVAILRKYVNSLRLSCKALTKALANRKL